MCGLDMMRGGTGVHVTVGEFCTVTCHVTSPQIMTVAKLTSVVGPAVGSVL